MYRVMIVDDEEYVRDLLVKNIQSSSLDVSVVAVAGDGREALELACELQPDIVITDIAMPFVDGLQLIDEMQKVGIHSKNVVVSGYDEFDYARKAIALGVKTYLLKPFLPNELYEVLQKLIQELDSQNALQQNMRLLQERALNGTELAREKAIKDLLNGRVDPKVKYEDLDIKLEGDYFLAGMIRLYGGNWEFDSQEKVEEFLVLLQNSYIAPNVRVYAVSFDGTQLSTVWCGKGLEKVFLQKIKNCMEKIQHSLAKYYQIQASCAFGRPYKDINDLSKSYEEVMAVWRGTLDTDNPIIFYGMLSEEKEEANNSQIRDWKNRIRLSVRTGQTENAIQQLQELMKCYASLANKRNDYIAVSVQELFYALQSDMEGNGYIDTQMEQVPFSADRIHYGSLKDMKEMLENYIIKCGEMISEHSEETKAIAAVKQIKMLIDSHIKNSDMDLEWIAEQVHFSSSYVRQIFRQYTGESIGGYLIRKRMEQAGMLLQKTNLRIQEISEECGYDNQRYFARSFKKYYGCTPTEFKKVVEEEHLY